jgi:hypothetical protein
MVLDEEELKEREAQEAEQKKRDQLFEHRMRAKSGMWQGNKSLSEDIKIEKEKTLERFKENFVSISEAKRRYLATRIMFRVKCVISTYENEKQFNGETLKKLIEEIGEDFNPVEYFSDNEVSYLIRVMINKSIIKHIEEKNLTLISSEQKYMVSR